MKHTVYTQSEKIRNCWTNFIVVSFGWLYMRCATRRKAAGSIPDEVIRISHWRNHSDRTISLGSTQVQRDMSTLGFFSGDKGGRCVGMTTLPPSCTDCRLILGASKSWRPTGPSRPLWGFTFICVHVHIVLFNDQLYRTDNELITTRCSHDLPKYLHHATQGQIQWIKTNFRSTSFIYQLMHNRVALKEY